MFGKNVQNVQSQSIKMLKLRENHIQAREHNVKMRKHCTTSYHPVQLSVSRTTSQLQKYRSEKYEATRKEKI